MDVNTINPILSAFANILPQIGFQKVERKSLALKDAVLENSGVMVNIGVLGPLKGAVLIGMDCESAKRFAATMMMGMAVTELDALAQSAIAEMGNMVCATACTKYSEAGITGLDISPPTLLIGKGGQIKLAVPKLIAVEFAIDDIRVEIYIGLSS